MKPNPPDRPQPTTASPKLLATTGKHDTRSEYGRTVLACFYKWVPFGAMVIIDETQQIYPDRRYFKLEGLDKFVSHPDDVFNGGMTDDLLREGRPKDVFTAYDKQLHYNWDIVF